MYREKLKEFVQEDSIIFVPKNKGLQYVDDLLKDIAGEELNILRARGEDIPKRVIEYLKQGKKAYGLVADDLFDEFKTADGRSTDLLSILNTYDWYDEKAKYRKPALCLINKTGNIEDLPKIPRIAINNKYKKTSELYIAKEPKIKSANFNYYNGDTEQTVADGINDCCVEIVYGGKTTEELGLKIIEPFRFSDIVLIGENKNYLGDMFMKDQRRVQMRKDNPRKESYTTKLLQDKKKYRDKLISEAAEVFSAIEQGKNIKEEIADLFYAINMIIAGENINERELGEILKKRME